MKVIIDGFKNEKSAKDFIDWFIHSGDQTYAMVLEYQADDDDEPEYIDIDCKRTYPLELKNDAYTMYLYEVLE